MVHSAIWLSLVKHLLQPSIPSSQERFNTWVCDNPAVVETGGGRDAFEAETQTMRSVRKSEGTALRSKHLNLDSKFSQKMNHARLESWGVSN
jgi:hypothetical protein